MRNAVEHDRRTIGLSVESQRLLEEIQRKNWFGEAQDVARFCLAYAIKAGVEAGTTAGVDTRWSASGFDNTGEMQGLVVALYPNTTMPVRAMEHFVNEGLKLVHDRLVVRG
jgi:hypothetical protein